MPSVKEQSASETHQETPPTDDGNVRADGYLKSPLLAANERQESYLLRRTYVQLKRALDILLVLGSAPVWGSVLVVCAVFVKLTSPGGPIFFHQMRTGAGGKRFKLFKLRTMVPNAEELKKELAHLNQLAWPDFKIDNDPRITKIGAFLRATSLDEIPQLINVLRGDMSLVGPRPTSFASDTYDVWHTQRLEIQPGLTGLWQITGGRGSMEFDERLRLDIAYMERRSLKLDVAILWHTVFAVLKKHGK
jgi:lipopolysaccharide/colanic/teichoic acid biosynthesis glycosyltransferase